MKVCCIAAPGARLSEAASGWCRALDAERRSFEEVCALLATQELRSDLLRVQDLGRGRGVIGRLRGRVVPTPSTTGGESANSNG